MTETKLVPARITDQARSRTGFVYDLRCEGAKLTLSIVPREQPTDAGDWKIEARTSHSPTGPVFAGWGPTRTDALHDVGRSWLAGAAEHGLPALDWEAVEKALRDVRAL